MTIEKSGLSSEGRAHPSISRSDVFKHGGDHGPLIGSWRWCHAGGRVANKKGQGDPAFTQLQDQPFGSIPSFRSFSRQDSLTHELKLPWPAMALICSSSESSKRMCFMVLPLRSNAFFCLSSCIGSYQYYNGNQNGNYHEGEYQYRSPEMAKPEGATNTNGPLTTTDKRTIEAAMTNRITPHQGRAPLHPAENHLALSSTGRLHPLSVQGRSSHRTRRQPESAFQPGGNLCRSHHAGGTPMNIIEQADATQARVQQLIGRVEPVSPDTPHNRTRDRMLRAGSGLRHVITELLPALPNSPERDELALWLDGIYTLAQIEELESNEVTHAR
jgi:hypothetical protein